MSALLFSAILSAGLAIAMPQNKPSPVKESVVLFEFPSLNLTDATLFNTFRIKLREQPAVDTDVFFGSDKDSLIFSDCHKTFDPVNWDTWQTVTVTGVPVFNSKTTTFMNIIARDFHGALTHDSFLPVTRSVAPAQTCTSIGDPHYVTFDKYTFDQQGSGTFILFDSPQLTIQTFQDIYSGAATVNKAVAVRYGKSIVVLDVTVDHLSPLKTVKDDGSMSGMVFTPASANSHDQVITLPCGSTITLSPNKGITTYINVNLALSAGYPANAGGICNRVNAGGKLFLKDGTSVPQGQVDAFANSWKIEDKASLFKGVLPVVADPVLKTVGSICKVPEKYTRPVPPPPPTPLPVYVPPPPTPANNNTAVAPVAAPPADFIKEATELCNKIFQGIFCNNIVDQKPFIAICIADSKTTGQYLLAEATKQSYLSQCHTQTNYMLYDPSKSVVNTATQVQSQLGLGNNTCKNQCSNNGQCTNSGCICKSGFTGSDCSISTVPLLTMDPSTQNFTRNAAVVVIPLPSYPQSAPISVPATPLSQPCTPGSAPPPVYNNPAPTSNSAPAVIPAAAPAPAPAAPGPAAPSSAAVPTSASAPTSQSAPVSQQLPGSVSPAASVASPSSGTNLNPSSVLSGASAVASGSSIFAVAAILFLL